MGNIQFIASNKIYEPMICWNKSMLLYDYEEMGNCKYMFIINYIFTAILSQFLSKEIATFKEDKYL